MKKLIFGSLLGLFVLTGCQNEDDKLAADITAEESKEIVESSGTNLSDDIVSLVESEGIDELVKLINLLDEHEVLYARSSRRAWTRGQIETIKQYFVDGPAKKVSDDGPNTLEDISGIYTWNFETAEFDFEESDLFTVFFPTEGSETNNAEFKISNLEYAVTEEGLDFDAPSLINAYLKVDDVTLVELAYDVNWSDLGVPVEADVNLLIAPFRFEIDFVDVFAKSTSLLTSVYINDEVIVSIDVDVSYESESKEDPFLIEGSVQYRNLKIDGSIDAREIGLDANPNDFINLALYSDEDKVGDIVFVLETDDQGLEDYIAYVEYADGTSQNLDEVLLPVFEEIEAIFAEFE